MSALHNENETSTIVENPCRCFSLSEIQSATNNFHDSLIIGIGGFGKVYKGFVDNGCTVVAIKQLNAESKQGAKEFWMEVRMLSELRHPHLVALIGYCNDSQEMILVYEYMAGGALADHLYKTSRKESGTSTMSPLSWEQRLDITIGAARGLDYLHFGTDQSFIHRDVKTANILLDEKWVAKIADFGLSKETASHSITHVSTDVKGTFGYLDPDYFLTQRLTTKSDVYAFGVVLLEVLCGRLPVDRRLEEEQISLVNWAQKCIKKGKLDRIIDPSLSGQISTNCLKCFVEVTNKCLHKGPKARPTMAEVVQRLEVALASQRKARTDGVITRVFQGIALAPKLMNNWWREANKNGSTSGPSKDSRSEPLLDSVTRRFSITEIRDATNDFSEFLLIGHGRSSKVYRGYVDRGKLMVAIKRLKEMTLQKCDKILTKIQVQSLLSHSHIVSLIGFCIEEHELILVYDYMANGSLRDHLYQTFRDPLPWKKRLEICIDAARGLQYIHASMGPRVIHRNITPSKILIDEKWVAKVTDFKLSKTTYTSTISGGLTTMANNNWRYLDSEYALHGKLTQKTDVYSFGVVLLDVLCAKDELPLLRLFKSSVQRGTISEVIDPNLIGKISPECLREFVRVAMSCLLDQGLRRPSMDDVVDCLQSALQLQEDWENGTEIGAYSDDFSGSYSDVVSGSYSDVFSDFDEFRIGERTEMIGTESPKTDHNFYNNLFIAEGEFTISGLRFFSSDFGLMRSESGSTSGSD